MIQISMPNPITMKNKNANSTSAMNISRTPHPRLSNEPYHP